MIQDVSHADNIKVNAALIGLKLDLVKDKKKFKMQVVGGCHALVHLMKNCLDKAIARILSCAQVTEMTAKSPN